MEPPSRQLQKRLTDLGLCQPADLRRCKHRVKRLARDLPAFDSVWIDALLQNKILTPFQAKQLESAHPQRLQVQSYLLVEPLGTSHDSQTFLARKLNGKQIVVLKQVDIPQGEMTAVQQNLLQLTNQFSSINTPQVANPEEVFEDLGQLVIISHRVEGIQLKGLLVRHGRVSSEVVMSLCRQVVDGLCQLEKKQIVHGDLQLKNIRLSSRGQSVLVDAGVQRAVTPELTIRADSSPEAYDGIAPELIGTGKVSDPTSDMYALGCLLWQLLAGRPPFPTGDPLSKLASHQTRRIENVSQWAPETSSELSMLIEHLTSPAIEDRPASWQHVAENIGMPKYRDKKVLGSFASQFSTHLNHHPGTKTKSKQPFMQSAWGLMVLVLFVSMGAVITLMDEGVRAKTLNILSSTFSSQQTTEKNTRASKTTSKQNKKTLKTNSVKTASAKTTSTKTIDPKWLPLPKPDAAGIIQLTETGPYAASDISAVGPLRIRGLTGETSRIIIESKPCKIWAEQLILENVHFEYQADSGSSTSTKQPATLLLVQSQDLAMFGCSFRTSNTSSRSNNQTAPLSVAWRPVEANDNGSRRLIVERTVFANGSALFLHSAPKSFSAKNCLKTGKGSFLVLGHPPKKGTVTSYQLNQVTLRNCTALLEMKFPTQEETIGQTIVDVNQSVLQLHKTEGTLFQFSAKHLLKPWLEKCEVTGEGTLAGNNLSTAKWYDITTGKKTELDPQSIPLEGLVGGQFQFAGDDINQLSHNNVIQWQAPLRSAQAPGVDVSRLPK